MERDWERDRREGLRERVCVCVCVCVDAEEGDREG